MPEPDLIELFVQPLNRFQIPYLVSGSVASMLYGEPRVTHDIDLVVFLRWENVAQLAEAYLKDIRGMLAVSGAQLDRSALNEWITRRRLGAEWQKASA